MILDSPNRFGLAVFGTNDNRGLVMTTAEGPPEAVWSECRDIARRAEELGFEAIIPLARWKGYGGANDLGSRVFETFTWAGGIAAVTERIQVFATLHVPTVHPVVAAKMGATVDHISRGRFGLNIVAGWQPEEIAMFGSPQREHDERYEVADEWAQIVERLWTTSGEVDFHGRFFDVPGGFLEPKPVQSPRPLIMSAGISPAGRRFAAMHADLVFVAIADPAATASTVAEVKRFAREEHGKDLRVYGRAHVTCGDTAQAAEDEYRHFILERGDREAGENVLRMLMGNSQTIDYESAEHQALVEAVIRGYFAHPVTGTPEQVVGVFSELADAGLDGVAVTWNDYEEGLRTFEERLLPLMVDAGLRTG
ncbi:MAG TPA: LLM class flavin-dependent oxidoreductase [Solirubrobacteraceae bacterium]|jgi:alkanesulfonate monooxygenase SsuD/methylene tetrahydromethanopterin reductase-like flavin-dependent oxidoreductase (luciferase family)